MHKNLPKELHMNTNEEYKKIVTNIKNIIKSKKLKKGDIALKLELSDQQFSDILHGRKLLRVENIPLIAEALEVDIADLFYPKGTQRLDYTRVIVEEDTENPILIASITQESIEVADGYRVRLTPCYD